MKHCHVFGCSNTEKNVKMHSFPMRNDKVFAIWVNRASNVLLDDLIPVQCGKSRFVCDEHFTEICKLENPSGRRSTLQVNALPTLRMPGFKGDPYDEAACRLNRVIFNLGKSVFNSKEKVLKLRTIGARLDYIISVSSSTELDKTEVSEAVVHDHNYFSTSGNNFSDNSLSTSGGILV